ncbi:MAG: hypothetical protein FWG52_09765 [Proteobacteria bacterium]|nr:hypothetical protein [Pseudomonadota bacterium]
MKTRCPCCGASFSLEVLIAHEASREAIKNVFLLGGELGAETIRYLALFRSAERDISMDRLARLLAQIIPDMRAGTIQRRGQAYDVPPAAWVWAMRQALSARESGRLKTPLTSHGWLYEALSGWRGEESSLVARQAAPGQPGKALSQTATAVAALESRINGR